LTSPFEVLGLLPSLVAELGESQLSRVVKEAGKGLQVIFHPDKLGGDKFRSTMINTALAALGNERDLGEFKGGYLRDGPGQAELREAEEKLKARHIQLRAMGEAIERGCRQKTDVETGRDVNLENLTLWVKSAYSDWHGEETEVWPIKSTPLEALLQVKEVNAPYLRHLPGMQFELAFPEDMVGLEDELDTLMNLDKETREGESDKLKRLAMGAVQLKWEIKRHSGNKSPKAAAEKEKVEKDVREREEAVKLIREKREKRRERIKELKAKIRQQGKSVRKGSIDENGHILIEGKATGLRVGGSSGFESVSIEKIRPLIITGEYFIGINTTGKPVCLGVLQNIVHKKKKETRAKPKFAKDVETKGRKGIVPRSTSRSPTGLQGIVPEAQAAATRISATALARREDATDSGGRVLKNPFESLGVLPSMAKELSPENLRLYVRMVGKALMGVTHPDAGGSKERFSEINDALTHLQDDAFFSEAKIAYADSAPEESRLRELNESAELAGKAVLETIPALARAKVDEKRARDKAKLEQVEGMKFLTLLFRDLFTDETRVPGSEGAIFLRRCDGMSLSIANESGANRYLLEAKGFDMLAVGENTDSFIRLMGSIRLEKFESLGNAKEMVEGARLEDVFLHAQPVIYPKGYLVGVKDNQLEVLGTIESIEKGRTVARKMHERMDNESPRKPKPRTRQS
jgi:hypothetical protein